MEPRGDALATDERQALEFFVQGLRHVSEDDVDRGELLYNASVLAHFSQVSTQSTVSMPTCTTLGLLFDSFVTDTSLHADGEMMETAAAQCLLLAGFFEDQMRRRHNITWYARLGESFFARAAAHQRSLRKARLLEKLARHFEPWRRRHALLSRELRDRRYLLPAPRPL